MKFKDYYKILQVGETADLKEIKKAYRKLALKFHPDTSSEADTEDKFKEVAEAYEVLKDSTKRAEYDELRRYGGSSSAGFDVPPGWQSSARNNQYHGDEHGDFSDFFNSFFAGRAQNNQQQQHHDSDLFKGQDLEMELPVFLEETLSGKTKAIDYHVPTYANNQVKQVKKTLKVKIPLGVADGERIRLKGQGAPGSENKLNGDLYLVIRLVPHPLFDVQGINLILSLPLTPWEAALGTKLEIPTLDGKVKLSIPANSQSGQKLRVKGKGLKSKTSQGDLFAVIKIDIPPSTNSETKRLWSELAEADKYNPRADWS
nr:DnaJ C-terminal domain-containing protein [uncultured Glaciecola sp.]